MENKQNHENSKDTEYTPIGSRALMNLATSQESKLKERERLQVAVIEERVGRLAQDLRNQFEKEVNLIKHDFDLKSQKMELLEEEMRRDNQRLREELKQAQDKDQSLENQLTRVQALNKENHEAETKNRLELEKMMWVVFIGMAILIIWRT